MIVERGGNRAIFIDKDGTLIKDRPYNVDPSKIEFYPEVVDALRLMAECGFIFIVISNQSGVAKGYFSEVDLQDVASTLRAMFNEHGIELSGFYCCPHDPEGVIEGYSIACHCRKPNPGLIVKAAKDFNIKLSGSWMIGDILNDVEAGNRAGCRTIMIDRKNETEWLLNEWRKPDFIVGNMLKAARNIISYEQLAEGGKISL